MDEGRVRAPTGAAPISRLTDFWSLGSRRGQDSGPCRVPVSQAVLPFRLALGVEHPGFRFGPGPAILRLLGAGLFAQVPRVLVRARGAGLGFFHDPLWPAGLPGGVFRQQLCLRVREAGGDGSIGEELELCLVRLPGIHGRCGAVAGSLGVWCCPVSGLRGLAVGFRPGGPRALGCWEIVPGSPETGLIRLSGCWGAGPGFRPGFAPVPGRDAGPRGGARPIVWRSFLKASVWAAL